MFLHPDILVTSDSHRKPLPGSLMITHIQASKNRLIGIHFAELTHNKMSDTEEVVEEEVQYVHIIFF